MPRPQTAGAPVGVSSTPANGAALVGTDTAWQSIGGRSVPSSRVAVKRVHIGKSSFNLRCEFGGELVI